MSKPRIIFFDIETAPVLTATFTLRPESISHSNIVKDWFIICAAWKELGSKTTEAVWITKSGDDKAVVKKLRDVLANADIIAGHNIKKFDIKKLNARLMYHRLQPLPPVQVIDTLTEVKKVSANISNRLDYLANTLVGGGKMETSHGLWLKAMVGDKKAIKEMVEYNKVDVIRNEQVYNVIKPYLRPSVHLGAIMGLDRHSSCPKCGSSEFDPSHQKVRYSAAGLPRIQKQCKICHSYSTFKHDRNEMPNLPKSSNKNNRNRQRAKR